jgi:hypothetical protein
MDENTENAVVEITIKNEVIEISDDEDPPKKFVYFH